MDAILPRVTDVPYVTTEQMIEVDRAMTEDMRIELIQMMENAGRNLAHLARIRFFGGNPTGKRVAVLAGTGGNGGGAMVCARRLHTWGAQVRVYLAADPSALAGVRAHQLDILRRMRIPLGTADAVKDVGEVDLVVDGLIGYRLRGNPRGGAKELIEWANAQRGPILALDTPSGVDTTTGTVHTPAIRAIATMTLALPKVGLRAPGVEQQVGELYLADIGVPPSLYAGSRLGFQVGPIFAESDIVRLR